MTHLPPLSHRQFLLGGYKKIARLRYHPSEDLQLGRICGCLSSLPIAGLLRDLQTSSD